MKRDYKLYLNDIRESIQCIEEYTKDISEEEFRKNKQLQDAVIRRFEIIGEASRNIPRALEEKNKHVPWFNMSQLRDLLSHNYYQVGLVNDPTPRVAHSFAILRFAPEWGIQGDYRKSTSLSWSPLLPCFLM